jgi:hypothetical protein
MPGDPNLRNVGHIVVASHDERHAVRNRGHRPSPGLGREALGITLLLAMRCSGWRG